MTWTVSEDLKSIPLFSCETYDVYNTSVLGAVIGFGAYAGHVIEFRVSYLDKHSYLAPCRPNRPDKFDYAY